MEKSKLDLYLTTNAKYFNAEAVPLLRQKLEKADDDVLAALQAVPLKDPTTVLIVSILLGLFGIDRFMIGDIGYGILKLLTGGGCGILFIVDWFLISKRTRDVNMSKISMVM